MQYYEFISKIKWRVFSASAINFHEKLYEILRSLHKN